MSVNFKHIEADHLDCQSYKSKTNDEPKRLSKVSINFQKLLSSIRPCKSYASTISSNGPVSSPSEIEKAHPLANNCPQSSTTSSTAVSIEHVDAERVKKLRQNEGPLDNNQHSQKPRLNHCKIKNHRLRPLTAHLHM